MVFSSWVSVCRFKWCEIITVIEVREQLATEVACAANTMRTFKRFLAKFMRNNSCRRDVA